MLFGVSVFRERGFIIEAELLVVEVHVLNELLVEMADGNFFYLLRS